MTTLYDVPGSSGSDEEDPCRKDKRLKSHYVENYLPDPTSDRLNGAKDNTSRRSTTYRERSDDELSSDMEDMTPTKKVKFNENPSGSKDGLRQKLISPGLSGDYVKMSFSDNAQRTYSDTDKTPSKEPASQGNSIPARRPLSFEDEPQIPQTDGNDTREASPEPLASTSRVGDSPTAVQGLIVNRRRSSEISNISDLVPNTDFDTVSTIPLIPYVNLTDVLDSVGNLDSPQLSHESEDDFGADQQVPELVNEAIAISQNVIQSTNLEEIVSTDESNGLNDAQITGFQATLSSIDYASQSDSPESDTSRPVRLVASRNQINGELYFRLHGEADDGTGSGNLADESSSDSSTGSGFDFSSDITHEIFCEYCEEAMQLGDVEGHPCLKWNPPT